MKFAHGLLLLAIVLASNAALGQSRTDLLDVLDKQERQWQTAQPKNYSYVLFSWYTFTRMTYEVTVRDGECTARSRARPAQKWTPDSCDGVRITDVFAELRKQWQSCPADVRLEFDEKYGFISDLTFEPKTDLSDQEWSITISKFKARK